MKKFAKHLLSFFDVGKSYNVNNSNVTIPYDSHVFSLPSGINVKNNLILKCLRVLKFDAHNTVFLDVGANVGQTLLAIKSEYPSVTYVGFEPNPVCVNYLHKLIKKNKFRDTKIFPVGLYSSNKVAEFFKRYSHDPCGSIVKEIAPVSNFEDSTLVPVFKFDDLNLKLNNKIVLKIDVEGSELEVLQGMSHLLSQHAPIIFCEVLHIGKSSDYDTVKNRAEDLGIFLKGHGYKIENIRHRDNSVYFQEVDNFIMKPWDDQKSIDECDYIITKNV